jgi:Cu-Zn family superoxide dismutase
LLNTRTNQEQEIAMNGRIPWHFAALVGAASLVAGCGPDTSEESRPGDSPLSRNEAGQPPGAASREAGGPTIRPPTTTTSPAAPGAAAPGAAVPALPPRLIAGADIHPLGDSTARGIVEFHAAASGDGPLTIHVMLMGVDAGPHGMHIHAGTDCAAPGQHLNPQNAPHGPANAGAAARHLGDLGNITADASGMVEEMLSDAQLGSDATFVGKVVVVHSGQDDLTTQPDGGAGDPIACGVIDDAETVISRSEDPDRGV